MKEARLSLLPVPTSRRQLARNVMRSILALLSLVGLLLHVWPSLLSGLLPSGPGRPTTDDTVGAGGGKRHLEAPPKFARGNSTMYPHPYPDMYGAPYVAVYGPASLDSRGDYEASLAVPSRAAQHLFGANHPYLRFMEDKYHVTTVVGPGVSSGGGYWDTDEMVVTLNGARLSVEYCRAEMRETVLNTEVGRVKSRPRTTKGRFDDFEREEHLSVPHDIVAAFWADGGKRIQELERITGARIQISDEPDENDPTAHVVIISGETHDAARNLRKELRNLLRMELAAAVDSITPGVWQIVSMRLHPEKTVFIFVEDGSTAKALVNRTGCRIQFSAKKIRGSHPPQQLVRITGPGDNPIEARRQIDRIIRKGESTRPQQVLNDLAAQNYEDMRVAQQHYENLKVANSRRKTFWRA